MILEGSVLSIPEKDMRLVVFVLLLARLEYDHFELHVNNQLSLQHG